MKSPKPDRETLRQVPTDIERIEVRLSGKRPATATDAADSTKGVYTRRGADQWWSA